MLILDNSTTAMTGLQEHPGTGRALDHSSTGKLVLEIVLRGLGVDNVIVVDPVSAADRFEQALVECLAADDLSVIIARRTCLLAVGKIKQYDLLAPPPPGENCQTAQPDGGQISRAEEG